MAEGFKLVINIAGLVVWHPQWDGRRASFIGVRTGDSMHSGHSHDGGHGEGEHSHGHSASLAYLPEKLAGLEDTAVPAPDPLFTDPGGKLFARRQLEDEILWLEPIWADDELEHRLEAEVPNLLSLSTLDSRVSGVDSSCLGTDLAGSPAVSRFDVSSGRLTEKKTLEGEWQVRAKDEAPTGEVDLKTIATELQLVLQPLQSFTIHSNKGPALRFASDGTVVLSYTVEPMMDFVPAKDDLLPHLGSTYSVMRWKKERPKNYQLPALNQHAAPWLTIKDRACPPVKG